MWILITGILITISVNISDLSLEIEGDEPCMFNIAKLYS